MIGHPTMMTLEDASRGSGDHEDLQIEVTTAEDGASFTRIVINELLTYCMYHAKGSTRDAVKRVVRDFYTPEEITTAKDTLWREYGSDVLGSTPSRHDLPNRSAHDIETDDILSALTSLIDMLHTRGRFHSRRLKLR